MKQRNVKKRGPANAVHPGEILREDFMIPLGLTATELAKHLHVSLPRVNDIIRERRGITADTAVRLSKYFGTSADVWMGLQTEYELKVAGANREIEKIKPRLPADAA